jgi:hypothetical protein
MKTKISIVREHMAAGRWRDAIKIAARFPRLDRHRDPILDAWTAYTHPDFMRQIDRDPNALIAAGQAALIDRFGK